MWLGVDYGLIVLCYKVDDEGCVCGVCDLCCICKVGFEVVGVFDFICYV